MSHAIELVARGRRDTMDHMQHHDTGDSFEEAKREIKTQWSEIASFWEDYWKLAKPRLFYRLWWAIVLSIVMTLILYGQPDNLQKITGATKYVPTKNWYRFIGSVIGINFIATAIDVWLFMVIDMYYNGSDTYRVRTDFFRGSFATLLTLFVIDSFRSHFKVPKSFDNWGDIMATLITVSICYIIKQYYQRLSYSQFVVTRFSERIKRMDVSSVILSRMACWTPISHPIDYTNGSDPPPRAAVAVTTSPGLKLSNAPSDRDLHSKNPAPSKVKKPLSDIKLAPETSVARSADIGINHKLNSIFYTTAFRSDRASTNDSIHSAQKRSRSNTRHHEHTNDSLMTREMPTNSEAMDFVSLPDELVTRIPFSNPRSRSSTVNSSSCAPSPSLLNGTLPPSSASRAGPPGGTSRSPHPSSLNSSMYPAEGVVYAPLPTVPPLSTTSSPCVVPPPPGITVKEKDPSSARERRESMSSTHSTDYNRSRSASVAQPRARGNAIDQLPTYRLPSEDDTVLANGSLMTAAGEVDATISIRKHVTDRVFARTSPSPKNSESSKGDSGMRLPAFRRSTALDGVGMAAGAHVSRFINSFASTGGLLGGFRPKSPAEELEFLSSPADIFADFIDDEDAAPTTAMAGETKSKSAQQVIDLTLRNKTFWKKLKAAESGEMRLTTVNGLVVIRTSKQAKEFGKKLYFHMRHGNFATIKQQNAAMKQTLANTGTPPAVAAAAAAAIPKSSQLSGQVLLAILSAMRSSSRCHPLTPKEAYSGNSNACEDIDVEWMTKACCEMFHCSPESSSVVTEGQVVETCYLLFKDFKNMALSLEDNRRLRKSIDNVIDVAFWMLMLVIAQLLMHIDPLLIITPMLSMILLLSFALGTVLGNMFLGIGFVVFMLPFDVGDRIAIGVGSNKIVCNVVSVELLHTTFVTIFNEKLTMPNHVLFGEKILNLQQSRNATLEIPVSFALTGPGAASQEKIQQFWDIMERWTIHDQKDNWKETFISLHTINAMDNNLGYSYWVTSRFTFAQTTKLYHSRRILIEKLAQTQKDVGIDFMSVSAPVELYDRSGTVQQQRPPATNSNRSNNSNDNNNKGGDDNRHTMNVTYAADDQDNGGYPGLEGLRNRRFASTSGASAATDPDISGGMPATTSFGNLLGSSTGVGRPNRDSLLS